MHGPTFMGNALACSVALKSIELFEQENYMDKIRRITEITRRELKGFEKVFLEPGETKNIVIELEGGLPEGRIALGTSLKEIRMEFSL